MIASTAANGLWSKRVIDGAGRLVATYLTNGAAGTSSGTAISSATGDLVSSEVLETFDADDNVILTTRANSFSGSTTTRLLVSGTTGRFSYSGTFYDNADRDVADRRGDGLVADEQDVLAVERDPLHFLLGGVVVDRDRPVGQEGRQRPSLVHV